MSDVEMGQSAEYDLLDAAKWKTAAEADGWEGTDGLSLFARAVEGLAWGLIDATMDTADREPSPEVYAAASNTARRILSTVTSPDSPTQPTDAPDASEAAHG